MAIVSVGALALALVVILINQKPSAAGGKLLTPPATYAGATVKDETLGSPTAPVVLAVYSDFQCPFCGRFVRDQFANLKIQFVDTGVLRIEAHDIDIVGRGTVNNESIELATGARCAAAQGKYWTYHDYVFWNQLTENAGEYNSDYIASIANASGLDMSAFNTCLAGNTERAAVIAETNAAHQLGVSSTPTWSLNGGALTAGVPDASTLASQIQALAGAASGSASVAPTASTAP
jgi:protein-disulfide isomerase